VPEPSVDWRYIFDSPPECSGSGGTLSASALFEVAWADREAFVNQALGLTSGSSGWPVPEIPWDCPFQPNSGLLANSFRFVPHSVKSTVASGDNTVAGHFDKAHVQIGFERPKYDYSTPTPQNQIDVANPILFCEQRIDYVGRTLVNKGFKYEYIGAPTGVVPAGDFASIDVNAVITLTFPFVPYIPWNLIEPYIRGSNDRTIFGKPAGTVALLGAEMRNETMSNGTNKTSCALRFEYRSIGWNTQLATDGNIYEIKLKGSTPPVYEYPLKNFYAIWS